MEILADAGYQGMGVQTGGRVVEPPHHKFRKDAPAWYEEMHERQRKTAFLATYSGRAWHCPPEELEGVYPSPRSPRTHERHRPSRRRTALTPADRHPPQQPSSVKVPAPQSSTCHCQPCTRSLVLQHMAAVEMIRHCLAPRPAPRGCRCGCECGSAQGSNESLVLGLGERLTPLHAKSSVPVASKYRVKNQDRLLRR